MDDRVDEFGQLFAEFVRRALENESTKEPPFRALIRDHLDADPTAIPVVAFDVADWDHANLQFALEALLAKPGREAELVGVGGGQKRYMALSLSDLINATHFEPGPVEYESLDVGPNTTHRCILFGLVFLRAPEGRAVLFVRRGDQQGGPSPGLMVEVLATDAEYASALLDELRALMREHNVFRGQMISLESTMWGQVKVVFHERPTTRRDEVILPEAVLAAIERQTLGIARRADALRAAGRHLKRGVLLHGPPGTGKTHTISWLSVINVSAHRISTIEVESALVDHPKVAEAAVCGRSDSVTGQAIVAYVTLVEGEEGSVEMMEELRNHVAKKIGPIAKPANIVFTPELPKTRSGKIMRRLLKDVAEHRELGDTTTLADPTVVEEIKERAGAATTDE